MWGHSKPQKPKTHGCDFCDKLFSATSELKRHKLTHTGEKPYPCTKCSYKTITKGELKRHLLKHQIKEPYHSCHLCGKKFSYKQGVSAHIRLSHHGGYAKLKCSCLFCGKPFNQKTHLFYHMRNNHTKEKPYLCSLCGNEFCSESDVNRHIIRNHTVERAFSCTFCVRRFVTNAELKNHQITHVGPVKLEKCEQCGKMCRTKTYLKLHIKRMHSSPDVRNRYICHICSNGFHTAAELKRHILNHRVACIFCEEKSNWFKEGKGAILRHIAKHTGESPWICSTCGREFLYKDKLQRHCRNVHKRGQ